MRESPVDDNASHDDDDTNVISGKFSPPTQLDDEGDGKPAATEMSKQDDDGAEAQNIVIAQLEKSDETVNAEEEFPFVYTDSYEDEEDDNDMTLHQFHKESKGKRQQQIVLHREEEKKPAAEAELNAEKSQARNETSDPQSEQAATQPPATQQEALEPTSPEESLPPAESAKSQKTPADKKTTKSPKSRKKSGKKSASKKTPQASDDPPPLHTLHFTGKEGLHR